MEELYHHLNIKIAYHIGHSMGVNVSLEFVRNYPKLCQGIVLISGTVSPVRGVMMGNYLMEYLAPLFQRQLVKNPQLYEKLWNLSNKNPLIKKIIHRGGFNPKETPLSFVDTYTEKLNELGPEIFFQLLNEMNQHDIIAYLDKINSPALIIGGTKDYCLPNYLQHLLSESLVHSELYMLIDGSHVPQVDFPDLINERILIFLKENYLV